MNISKMKKVNFAKSKELDLQYDKLKDEWIDIV